MWERLEKECYFIRLGFIIWLAFSVLIVGIVVLIDTYTPFFNNWP